MGVVCKTLPVGFFVDWRLVMNWKQPIPTGLEETFQKDWGCNLLYQQLIYRSANSDGFFTDKNGVTTEIKRGQTIFGRGQYGQYLCQSPSTVRNWLSKLFKIYKIVDIQDGVNFTIVTIKNYDEVTVMDNLRTTKGQPKDTSKNVKSVKKELYSETELQQINEVISYWNSSFKGIYKFKADRASNIHYHLKDKSIDEIKKSINNLRLKRKFDAGENFWDGIGIDVFFRRRNRNQEEVDYVADMFAYKPKVDYANLVLEEQI